MLYSRSLLILYFIYSSVCVYVFSCSVASDSLRPYGLTVARQAPLSIRFSRQKYWSGLPFPPPGDLPNPGTECISFVSCIVGTFFTADPLGKPIYSCECMLIQTLELFLPTTFPL